MIIEELKNLEWDLEQSCYLNCTNFKTQEESYYKTNKSEKSQLTAEKKKLGKNSCTSITERSDSYVSHYPHSIPH